MDYMQRNYTLTTINKSFYPIKVNKLFSLKNNYSYICETLTHSYYVSLQQYSHSNPIR